MKIYSICSCLLGSLILQGISSSDVEVYGHDFRPVEKMEARQTLRSALQSAIENDNAEALSQILKDSNALTILNSHPITGEKEGTSLNDFLLESIKTNRNPALISTLLQSILQSNSDTETLPYLLQKIQASTSPNTSNVLTTTLTDPSFVTSMFEKNGALPEQAKTNYLTLLDQTIKDAPFFVRVGYPAIKGAVKVCSHSIKKMNETLRSIKNGQYKTSHNQNNAAHLSILECNSKALSWCIMNCQPTIFSQKNAQGSTPLEFAYLKKGLLEAMQQKNLQQTSILQSSGKLKIFSLKARHVKKLQKELLRIEKQLTECSCIIQMLESLTPKIGTHERATLEKAPALPLDRMIFERTGLASLEEAPSLPDPVKFGIIERASPEMDSISPFIPDSAQIVPSEFATFETSPILRHHYSSCCSEESSEE